MGTYLIPNATSLFEAIDYIGEPQLEQTWSWAEGGILFADTTRTDVECAALYAGYTPSGQTDEGYRRPPTAEVQAALDTLKAFYQANPSSITAAQAATLHRAEVVVLREIVDRLRD